MVDVVREARTFAQIDEVAKDGHEVVPGQDRHVFGNIQVQALVPQEVIWEIQGVTEKLSSLKAYFEHFAGKYDYDTLRLVLHTEK